MREGSTSDPLSPATQELSLRASLYVFVCFVLSLVAKIKKSVTSTDFFI